MGIDVDHDTMSREEFDPDPSKFGFRENDFFLLLFIFLVNHSNKVTMKNEIDFFF